MGKNIYFLIFFGLLTFLVFGTVLTTAVDALSGLQGKDDSPEKNKVAEWKLYNTERIEGKIISKKDKSFIKKEDSVLLFGGGERKVEDYQFKVKYQKDKIKTIKVSEKDFLNYNNNDDINVVISQDNNKVKYNLKNKTEKERYVAYKKALKQ